MRLGVVPRAGRDGVDILLAPSFDWDVVARTHEEMAAFRAIENGFSILKATSGGDALAVDACGRILGSTGSGTSDTPTLLTALPTRGARTLYARFGDWFAWLSAASLITLGVHAAGRG